MFGGLEAARLGAGVFRGGAFRGRVFRGRVFRGRVFRGRVFRDGALFALGAATIIASAALLAWRERVNRVPPTEAP
ncbi:MAG: hypothetical protein JKY00_00820 [Roseicyclus sp.]|nr:hypothetical protein [Roseicyclus sp.]